MGLFGKKRADISRLPELPKFEDDADNGNAGFLDNKMPNYDSAFTKETEPAHEAGPIMGGSPFKTPQIKDDLDIPPREPAFQKQKPDYTEDVDTQNLDLIIPKAEDKNEIEPQFKKEIPMQQMQQTQEVIPKFESYSQDEEEPEQMQEQQKVVLRKPFKVPKKILDERPVFVQIDDYKDAMNSIEVLKQKVREVEYILDKLNEIKSQEQLEMSNCETSLNKIKERLIEIDKKLFEI